MVFIVISRSMFQYKDTIWGQHILFKYQKRHFIHIFEGIRRVRKDEIVLFGALFYKFKNIAPHDVQFISNAKRQRCFFNEIYTGKVALYKGEVFHAA